MTKEEIILKIAQSVGFSTLKTRKSDRLDFKEIAVWQIKEILEQAYEEGYYAGVADEIENNL